jgi:hypothetical protein
MADQQQVGRAWRRHNTVLPVDGCGGTGFIWRCHDLEDY